MPNLPELALAAVFATLCLTTSSTAQGGAAWIVDKNGAGDFLDLPLAVASAASGDTLIVRSGPTYSAFTVDGKALTIVAEGAERALVHGAVRIENLTSSQRVVLRGLNAKIVMALAPMTHTLADCAGPVWIEDCVLESLAGQVPKHGVSLHGLALERCTAVTVVRSELLGGYGQGAPNGNGLDVAGSSVALFESRLEGAGNLIGTHGAHGVALRDDGATGSFVSAYAVELRGGHGGIGRKFVLPNGPVCGDGGKGGSGVRMDGSASRLDYFDASFSPGNGGDIQPGCASSASPGPPGQDILQLEGDVQEGGPCILRTLSASSPLEGNAALDLVLTGAPGEIYVVGYSTETAQLAIPEACSVLQVPTIVLLASGVVPGSGTEALSIATAAGPPGWAVTYFVQGVFDGQSGGPSGGLSSPSTSVVYTE